MRKSIDYIVAMLLGAVVCACQSDGKEVFYPGQKERDAHETVYINQVKASGKPCLDLFDLRQELYTAALPSPLDVSGPGQVAVMFVSAEAGQITVPYNSYAELYCVTTAVPPYIFTCDRDKLTGEIHYPDMSDSAIGDTAMTLFRQDLISQKTDYSSFVPFFWEFHPEAHTQDSWHVDATDASGLTVDYAANESGASRLLAITVGWHICWDSKSKYLDRAEIHHKDHVPDAIPPKDADNSGPWANLNPGWEDFQMYQTVLIFQASATGDTGEADFAKGAEQFDYLQSFVAPFVAYSRM